MDIGKKIKELRLSKMMTQTELAGHEITRNMLSRIENGAALPSLGTIIYLAERLGVPAGLLLAEDGDSFVFVKNNILNNIKRAYIDSNFELCRDMCRELLVNGNDDEVALIMCEATYKLAELSLLKGNLHASKRLLDDAIAYCDKTMYNTDAIYHCSKNLFYHIRQISPALDSDIIDCKKHANYSKSISFSSEVCRYLNILQDIENNEYNSDSADIDDPDMKVYFKLHIEAKLNMRSRLYEKALDMFYTIINHEDIVPAFVMYLVSADIEICSKEVGDYKSAYEYSTNKISLLESMLSEG